MACNILQCHPILLKQLKSWKIGKEGLSVLNRTFGHELVVLCTILSMCGKFLASQEFDLEWTDIENYLIKPTLPTPSMHPKLTEHGKSCMQINQLPTKSSNDVTDKFNTLGIRQQGLCNVGCCPLHQWTSKCALRINEKWKRTGYEGQGDVKIINVKECLISTELWSVKWLFG